MTGQAVRIVGDWDDGVRGKLRLFWYGLTRERKRESRSGGQVWLKGYVILVEINYVQ